MAYRKEYMTKSCMCIATGVALIFIGWSPALGQKRETASPERALFRKRQFTYGAEKFSLRIIEAVITLEKAQSEEGKEGYLVQARVETTGVTNWFFRMHNRFHSRVDARNLSPLRYVKEINQRGIFSGEKKYTSVLTFNQGDNRVVVDGSKIIAVPPRTQDPLSFFVKYYIGEEIKTGEAIRMTIYDGIKLRKVIFNTKGESIDTQWCGQVEVVCLESKVPFSSLGGREGIIKIWCTRDRRKVPVRIGLDLPIGMVRFELESFEEW